MSAGSWRQRASGVAREARSGDGALARDEPPAESRDRPAAATSKLHPASGRCFSTAVRPLTLRVRAIYWAAFYEQASACGRGRCDGRRWHRNDKNAGEAKFSGGQTDVAGFGKVGREEAFVQGRRGDDPGTPRGQLRWGGRCALQRRRWNQQRVRAFRHSGRRGGGG